MNIALRFAKREYNRSEFGNSMSYVLLLPSGYRKKRVSALLTGSLGCKGQQDNANRDVTD